MSIRTLEFPSNCRFLKKGHQIPNVIAPGVALSPIFQPQVCTRQKRGLQFILNEPLKQKFTLSLDNLQKHLTTTDHGNREGRNWKVPEITSREKSLKRVVSIQKKSIKKKETPLGN